ncbi:putative leucine-rich repeat-containing protein DDB_G0290503 [Ruditapes philippinarum]|uniref:putative leucine-rich repeat-containing protein DDB_G0290503 n=1 Tax=Ruditapes philippinarum TaxID=129788 RepID=UPI00295BAC0D|nr:putative leucine-rich repeat-containing protein DDB_G0290503 [Ruditapes philippinarum]
MENLVSDALNDPDNDEDLKRSIGDSHNKIVKLKESEMTLTLFEDAQKAMRIKRTAIYYDFEQYLCDNDLEQLKTILKFAEQVTTITDSQQDIKANDVDFQKLEERLKEKSKVLQEDIANINTKFRYSEDRVNVFKTQNIEKQEEITSNNAKIRILEDKLHNEIANKNDTISDLKERINDRTNINGILQKELANNKEVIRVLEDKLNIKEEQINGLQEEILKNKDTITNILQLKKNREIDSLKLKIFATACLAAVISVVYLGLRKS